MNKKVIDNFTPGPWAAYHHAHNDTYTIHVAGRAWESWAIAQVGDCTQDNARLIAAAPALLAALQSMISMEGRYWAGDDIAPDSTLGRALAAIAQARGA